MDLLNQLISFLVTPLGLLLTAGGVVVAMLAKPSRPRLRWLIFSTCGFAASLSTFDPDRIVGGVPPLVFPLEFLRAMGRPITLVLVLLLLLNLLITRQANWRHRCFPTPIKFLMVVQAMIVVKILSSGNITFALLTTVTYSAIVTLIALGPSRWLQSERDILLSIWSIAMVGVIFALVNLYQAAIDTYPLTFLHGWFLGTTGNPHHAAVLIVSVLPSILFFCHHRDKNRWNQWLWLGCLGLAVIGLAATASRTGMTMAIAAVLAFYWRQSSRLVRLVLIGTIVVLVGVSIIEIVGFDVNLTGVFSTSINKIEAGQDTRSEVFRNYWNNFLAYPLFGMPLTGERLLFRESSWLGVAGSLGLMGLVPMAFFGLSTIQMIYRLHRMMSVYPSTILLCSTVTSGLVALLIGGITEAYLLGNLSFAVLALFLYLAMGSFLLEVSSTYLSSSGPRLTVDNQSFHDGVSI